MREPLLHTSITDCLPDAHPLAWTTVYCEVCGVMLHASNNENMCAWVETGHGPRCLRCFAQSEDDEDFDDYGLPEKRRTAETSRERLRERALDPDTDWYDGDVTIDDLLDAYRDELLAEWLHDPRHRAEVSALIRREARINPSWLAALIPRTE